MQYPSPLMLSTYAGVGILAGFIDTLAGGGGLITVPALLLGGMPSILALGTNKLQGACGAFVAAVSLVKRSKLNPAAMLRPFAASLAGGVVGAIVIQGINPRALDFIVPVVLVIIATYFLFAPKAGEVEQQPRLSNGLYCALVLPLIGFYDGFFGPGTGSFYALTGVSLRGWNLVRATAGAKLFNFASSLASLFVFIYSDQVSWTIGFVMILGQVVGARLGSKAVLTGGPRIIRPLIVAVSIIMLARYAWQKGFS